ncbi:RHS repeat-associated core domain-containing protein [Vibrio vulnificus]|nr:RHS repeat-associated core domain-containing protein [Vibrio vulnificus]
MGFTGHEMLDDMGLIHMNGRVYDPTLARFLSTDPYIQDKWFGTQAFNRYSYVQNNPLSYVDPTGLYSQAPNGMGTSSDAARARARASDAQAMANTGAIAFGGYAGLAKSQSAVANEGGLATTLQDFTDNEEAQRVSKVVDSTFEALNHYFAGNGEGVELGPMTKDALRNHPLVQRQSEVLRTGRAKHLNSNLSVEMRDDVYHVGKTRVDFSTVCQSGSCTTTYLAFSNDGFWDPIAPTGFGDGIEGSWELHGGTGYQYNPYTWSETYKDYF